MNSINRPCYIFDLDGTLANLEHRLHHIRKSPKDWDSFFGAVLQDEPIHHMLELYRKLRCFTPCLIVSGRSEICRPDTVRWLCSHDIVYDALLMRKARDRRPDDIIKAELLSEIRAEGYKPIMAFDDRDRVVRMWRENGVPCSQVAEGNF